MRTTVIINTDRNNFRYRIEPMLKWNQNSCFFVLIYLILPFVIYNNILIFALLKIKPQNTSIKNGKENERS